MNRPLRIAAIHDLSGFGRCSLTVILPVLSAMGMQVCPVPTAVLSTHTGGMGEVVMRDLTDFLEPALDHYRRLELAFECIYTGFLGSPEQISHCLDYFRSYPQALAVVDPVMGDHGKSYRTVTGEMRGRMLARLSELGPEQVVITGASLASGERMANLGYDRGRSAFWYVACDYVPVSYPGTGDLFAAVLTGALLQEDSLPMAINRATRFCELAIKTTFGYGSDPRHGVMLERSLGALTQREILSDYQLL